MRFLGVALIFPLCLSVACGRRPSDVIPDNDMASLLADMYKAEAYVSSNPTYMLNDSLKRVLREEVLAEHGTDEKTFTQSLDWYGHNIDRLEDIYDRVEQQLNRETSNPSAVRSGKKGEKPDGLWVGDTRVALTPSRSGDRISFETDGRTLTSSDNELVWEFVTSQLPGRITAFVGADYTDGTFSYTSKTFNSGGPAQIALVATPGKKVKRVFGQAVYLPVYHETVFIDSIRLITRPSHTPDQIPMR